MAAASPIWYDCDGLRDVASAVVVSDGLHVIVSAIVDAAVASGVAAMGSDGVAVASGD